MRGVQKADDGGGVDHPSVEQAKDNDQVAAALAEGANLVAGTAWLFARSELKGGLDTLAVDEAGQLLLANVLAVAGAADRLVLVGDPRQLAQPSKGTHPEGAEVSGLDHVLGDHDTMPSTSACSLTPVAAYSCTFLSRLALTAWLSAVTPTVRRSARSDDHMGARVARNGALLAGTLRRCQGDRLPTKSTRS